MNKDNFYWNLMTSTMNAQREEILLHRRFNQGFKDLAAQKWFGKNYNELTRDEQLDCDDMLEVWE